MKNNDKNYDVKCFYKHNALLFLCSTKKKKKKRQNLEMFFWLNLNEMRENEQKKNPLKKQQKKKENKIFEVIRERERKKKLYLVLLNKNNIFLPYEQKRNVFFFLSILNE
jgi:hypothetical protein